MGAQVCIRLFFVIRCQIKEIGMIIAVKIYSILIQDKNPEMKIKNHKEEYFLHI